MAMASVGLQFGSSCLHCFAGTSVEVASRLRWHSLFFSMTWSIEVFATMKPQKRWFGYVHPMPDDSAESIRLRTRIPAKAPNEVDVVLETAVQNRGTVSAEWSSKSDPFATHIHTWRFWKWRASLIVPYEIDIDYGGCAYSFSGELVIPVVNTGL